MFDPADFVHLPKDEQGQFNSVLSVKYPAIQLLKQNLPDKKAAGLKIRMLDTVNFRIPFNSSHFQNCKRARSLETLDFVDFQDILRTTGFLVLLWIVPLIRVYCITKDFSNVID